MIEQTIINNLLHNDRYSRKVIPYLNPDYFEDHGAKTVFEMVREFYGKYNTAPTQEALLIELDSKNMPEGVYNSASNCIRSIRDDQSDYDWLVETSEKWSQERAVYNAVMDSISILEGRDKKKNKHSIPTILSQALGVCFDSRIGHDYFDQAEEQWEYYNKKENKIPFNTDIMNRITKGGVTRKTLSVVMAGINVGKTTWLINMAENYLEQGLNVLYITLEVAEEVIRERSDACMFNMTFDEVRALDKIPYLNRVKEIRGKTRGSLIVRQFPSSTVHVGHIRHIINEIKLKRGIKPDVIIIDYLTLLLSSILPPSSKADSNGYFTSVTEELRALMIEFEAVGWTAAQFNRGGQSKDDVGMDDTGLSIGIQATADFTVAFMQPEELAKMHQVLGKVLKNRFANKVTINKFVMGLDNDRQKYSDVSRDDQKAVMGEEEMKNYDAMQAHSPVTPHTKDWSIPSKPPTGGTTDSWKF